jgi:hypothetical protein
VTSEHVNTVSFSANFNIRYHFTKNAILERKITLKYCSTTELVADMMTKPLIKMKQEEISELAGLVRTSG